MRVVVWVSFAVIGGCAADARAPRPAPAPAPSSSGGAVEWPKPPEQARSGWPDDPKACVEPANPEETAKEAWDADVKARIDAVLPKLTGCSPRHTSSAERAVIVLGFDDQGRVESQQVVRTTFEDCAVTRCMKRGLASLRVSKPLPAARGFWLTLDVAAGTTPRRAEVARRSGEPEPEAGPCAEPETGKGLIGQLPPELIQRKVREGFSEIRRCYEAGLGRYSLLSGRVTVKFAIGSDGAVKWARVSENALPDCQVTRCVVSGFKALKFPEPAGGGVVTVVYPIQMQPGESD